MKNKGKVPEEDYSYLDDEDVYEEYLDPNSQIEVDEDEEVEIIEIVSPPPFGAFAPPPRFGGIPYQNVGQDFPEEIDFDEGEVYEFEPEPSMGIESNRRKGKTVRPTSETQKARYCQMATAQASAIADKGEEQAKRISSGDVTLRIVSFIKIVVGVAFFLGMSGVCCVFVFWNYLTSQKRERADNGSDSSSVSSWSLPPSASNDVIRYFYDSLGNISAISGYRDMLVKGTLELNGKTEDFYCIRRANGNCYVKIGSIDNERAYYISNDSEGVYRLIDMRANGRRESLSVNESLVLRALATFDENMFKLAFGNDVRVIGSTTEGFAFGGKSNTNGMSVDILKCSLFGVNYKYCFSSKDGSLLSATMSLQDSAVTVEYSDYQDTNIEMKYPFARKILLNGKPFGSVRVKVALVNKGFVIP